MVQLKILSGRNAGHIQGIREFPCVVGRAAQCDFRLEEAGIWDRHFQINFTRELNFAVVVLPDATLALNHAPVEQSVLKNGDLIDAGGVKLQFWITPTRQRSLFWREAGTWIALGILCAAQIALVYGLLH